MCIIEDIHHKFDLILLDQFGVLHDGESAYQNAVEVLENLTNTPLDIVIISNSGKRSSHNEHRLVNMGFSSHHWTQVLTSGELTWIYLKKNFTEHSPQKVFVISNDDNYSILENTGLKLTQTPSKADLLLIAGSRAPEINMAEYMSLLEEFISRNVPAICSNPDLKLITTDSNLSDPDNFGPGVIAKAYENMGGSVTYFGKPHREIYDYIFEDLSMKGRTLCIGDSLEHDIKGAQNIGVQSMFINSGIYKSDEEIEQRMEALGVKPDYFANELKWK